MNAKRLTNLLLSNASHDGLSFIFYLNYSDAAVQSEHPSIISSSVDNLYSTFILLTLVATSRLHSMDH